MAVTGDSGLVFRAAPRMAIDQKSNAHVAGGAAQKDVEVIVDHELSMIQQLVLCEKRLILFWHVLAGKSRETRG